jgi:hypothetical protein
MTPTENKKILRKIVGLLVGLIFGSIVFLLLLGVSFCMGLFGWSDGGDPTYLRRLEFTSEATLVISTIVSFFTVFLIARKIIKSGNITID